MSLLYGSATEADILLRDELDELAGAEVAGAGGKHGPKTEYALQPVETLSTPSRHCSSSASAAVEGV